MKTRNKQIISAGLSLLLLGNSMLIARPVHSVFAAQEREAMTKSQLASELYDLANRPEKIGFESFLDVSYRTPNYKAITWATNNDLLKGNSMLVFGTNGKITLRTAISALYKLAGSPTVFGDLSGFIDHADCMGEENAFIWATQNRLFDHNNTATLQVNSYITAQEFELMKNAYVNYSTAEYFDYLCLGDSVATGYDPRTNEEGVTFDTTWHNMDYAYHSLLANALGANLTSRAAIGLRTSELRAILEYKDGDKDDVSDEYHIDPRHIMFHNKVSYLHDEYVNAIKDKDIITLQIGLNDVYTAPFNHMKAEIDLSPLGTAINKALSGNVLDVLQDMNSLISLISTGLKTYASYADQGLEELQNCWSYVIDDIRAINPTAKLIVIGGSDTLPNPLTDILVNPITTRINKMNTFFKVHASLKGYVFVDMGDPDSFMNNFLRGKFENPFDAHPTVLGHQQMTKTILSTLPDSAIKNA